MITEDEKAEIKKVLGHRYAAEVQNYLNEKGLLNSNNKKYSKVQIRNVMSGINHAIIETAIWAVFASKKEIIENRKKLLSA